MGKFRPVTATNAAGSHLPITARLLDAVHGPVLELGAGFFSTPLLFWSCRHKDMPFHSYDTNKQWAEKMGDAVTHVTSWDEVDLVQQHWAVAFVDHGDATLRKEHAMALRDTADYIVLHDTEPAFESTYGFSQLWPHFRHVKHFTAVEPYTTIVSNSRSLDWL